MKKQRYLTRSIIALVLAILTTVPWIGYIFGVAGVILAIDTLISLKKAKLRKGKAFAISALIIVPVIMLIKIMIFLAYVFSGVFSSVADFSQLGYEDAVIKCEEQTGDLQTACYMGLLVLHSNDTRVKSGETCYGIKLEEAKTACFTFVAALTNNTKICEEITISGSPTETWDIRNYCLAMIAQDSSYCEYISDSKIKLRCTSETTQRRIEKDIYS